MILLVNVCNEDFHELEFVKPIEDLLKKLNKKFKVKHYKEINPRDLSNVKSIIICGTSLKDHNYLENILSFSWIKNFKGKILGICAGMQIIGIIFGGKIKQGKEIGFYFEKFNKDFLGLSKSNESYEVYHLHNSYIDFTKLDDFEVYCGGDELNKISQAIKHIQKEIYGVLFHPEVRQKDLIINFLNS